MFKIRHENKGISSAAAAVIIATISVTLVGTTYFFSKGLTETTMAETFEIVDIFQNRIIVRNTGTQSISKFRTLINGKEVKNEIKDLPIQPQSVGTVIIDLESISPGRHQLTLITKSMSQTWMWEFKIVTTTVVTTTIETTTITPLEEARKTPEVKIEQIIAEFERDLICHKCGKHKAPPLAEVNMTISITLFQTIGHAKLIDYYPNEWTVINANGGVINEYNSSYNKIEWDVRTVNDSISKWYTIKSPQKTTPSTKYYFYAELFDGENVYSEEAYMVVVADPTVGTTVSGLATRYSFQRKTFRNPRGLRYYYTFYRNGTQNYYAYSPDGTSWTTGQEVWGVDMLDMSVWIWDNGNNLTVYVVGCEMDPNGDLWYRRGTITDSSPSISWDVAQEVNKFERGGNDGCERYVDIVRADDGYIWLIYNYHYSTNWYGVRADVSKIPNTPIDKDNDWVHKNIIADPGASSLETAPAIVPSLDGHDVGIIYTTFNPLNFQFKSKYADWNGNALSKGGETNVDDVTGLTTEFSAVTNSTGDVDLLYKKDSSYILHKKWDVSTDSWSTENVVFSGNAQSVALSKNDDTDDLYAFYIDAVDNDVYYKKSMNGGIDWGSGTKFYTGTAGNVSSSYQDYGKKITVIWTNKTDSKYNVYFDSIKTDLISPQYSSNSTSSTVAGIPVEFRLRWTDDIELDSFIFSLDNCTGSFKNVTESTFPIGGTADWSNVVHVINSTDNCRIRWKVYANDTSDNWNTSQEYSFNTTKPWLNVTLLTPDPSTCTESFPCDWNQTHTFWINATIECMNDLCGNVNGTARYSDTASTMKAINITKGATPFYLIGPLFKPSTYENDGCSNPTAAYDDDFNDTSTATGCYGGGTINYTFNLPSTNDATLFLMSMLIGTQKKVSIYNYTSNGFDDWLGGSPTPMITLNSTPINTSSGWLSPFGQVKIRVNGTDLGNFGAYYDLYINQPGSIGADSNKKSCGILTDGDTCQLNWIVNVNGNSGEVYKIDVKFMSDLGIWNDTDNAVVRISPSYCDRIISSLYDTYKIDQDNTIYCLVDDLDIAGKTAINFTSGVQNSTLDCLGYNINSDDTSNTYGVYLAGNNTKNNTIKNCNITNFCYGIILLSETSENTIVNNNFSSSDFGIYIAISNSNNVTNNTCYDNNNGIYVNGYWSPGTANNRLVDNSVFNNNYGVTLFGTHINNNNITGGSIHGNSESDYKTIAAPSLNYFKNTNFTETRKIRFTNLFSYFSYNNASVDEIWLKTNVSAKANITRELTSWTQSLVQWNDSADQTVTARYNISGLNSDTWYGIYNDSKRTYVNKTDSDGKLPSFTIDLSSEHEIKVQEIGMPEYCDISILEFGRTYTIDQDNTIYCLVDDLDIAGKTAINFTSGVQNSTLDCLNHNLNSNDTSNTYGVYLTGSETKNNTVKNCDITNFEYGVYLRSETGNNTLINNTVSSSPMGFVVEWTDYNTMKNNTADLNTYGIFIASGSDYNNILNNIIINNNDYGIWIASVGENNTHNYFRDNKIKSNKRGVLLGDRSVNSTLIGNIIENNQNDGIWISSPTYNNIINGSIKNNSPDYYLQDAGITNYFRKTNFTDSRTIHFEATTSWFNYNNETTGNIWLKTNVSSAATIERKLTSWTQFLMQWNDSSFPSAVTTRYNITGLKENTKYNIFDNLVLVYQELETDSDGRLNFTIDLSSEHEIKVAETGIGWLNVTLSTPDPKTCNETSPCGWNRFSEHWVNATVECKGGQNCGSVNGTARYNKTGTRPINHSTTSTSPGSVSNPKSAYDDGYNDSSTYANINSGGSLPGQATATYTFSLGIDSATIFATADDGGATGGMVDIYNFTSGSWDFWFIAPSTTTTYFIVVNTSSGYVNATYHSKIRASVLYSDEVETVHLYDTYTTAGETMDLVNTTKGAIPFYITYPTSPSYFRPVSYSSAISGTGSVSNEDQAYDNDYNDSTTYALADSGDSGGDWVYINYTYSLDPSANITLFARVAKSAGTDGGVLYIYNFTEGGFDTWKAALGYQITYNTILNTSSGWMNSTGHAILRAEVINAIARETIRLYDTYAEYDINATNRQSCGSLSEGDICQLKWRINVTGSVGNAYKIDVNFTSDLGIWNDTDDAVIKITEPEPPKIWNLIIRNTTDDQITETRPAREVRITVNISGDNLDYVEANFTWPDGTIVYENLTSISGKPYTHNWTYWLPPTMPTGTAKINVTAYDTSGFVNSTNTTLDILEYYEFDLSNTPVNFSKVHPGEIVEAIPGEGWPLFAVIEGNVPVNLTQYAEPYLTGLDYPSEIVVIRNITWNTSDLGEWFSQLTDIETVVNESVQEGSWQQPIYYKFNVPPVSPQRYGGIVYIKTKKSEGL